MGETTFTVRLAAVDGKLIGSYKHPAATAPPPESVIDLKGRAWRIVAVRSEQTPTIAVRPASV